MKYLRKVAFVVALLLTLTATAAQSTRIATPSDEEKDRFRFLQEKFVCQCGCNYNLLHCPHLVCPSAPQMRLTILEEMREGKTDEQIVASMVGSFGEVALSQPSTEGFNLVGWVMPFVALLAGLILLQAVVKAWRKRSPQKVVAANTEILERYRGAIEKEMKDLEE